MKQRGKPISMLFVVLFTLLPVGHARAMHTARTRLPVTALSGDARAGWLHSQQLLANALDQTGPFGASVSHEDAYWGQFVAAFTAYMHAGLLFAQPDGSVQKALNQTSTVIGYFVQGWRTPIGHVRIITVSTAGKPDSYGPQLCSFATARTLYVVQLIVWRDVHGNVRVQSLWRVKDISVFGAITDGGGDVTDLRAWRGHGGASYIAILDTGTCGASGNWVNATGIELAPRVPHWTRDAAMFPADLWDGLGGSYLSLYFTDAAGQGVMFDADAGNNAVSECHACEHVFGTRLFTRDGGAVYQGQPWVFPPSPYLTLVQAVSAAQRECLPGDLSAWFVNDQVAADFCNFTWSHGAISVSGSQPQQDAVDTPTGPHYLHRRIVYTLQGVSPNPVAVTVIPVGSGWLISHVS